MSNTFGAPGVYIQTQLIGPSPQPSTVSPSVAGFTGEHWRGPTGAVQCNSWSDFVKFFGGFNPNVTPVLANPWLPYAVYQFFANGGQTCWVQRIVASGSPGASAAVTLKDSSATPQNTLTLTAGLLGAIGNSGTWGNQLFCQVSSSVSSPGRFNLNIYYGGVSTSNLVESWNSVSMVQSDSRYVVSLLNSPTQGSVWVVATDLFDVATPPNNTPTTIASAQFSGGTDGTDPSVPDRVAAVTVGTSSFDLVHGVLNFNMPGESTAAVMAAATTYAKARPYTFCVIDPPVGQTPAGAVSYFNSISPAVAQAALYYPWVVASNPANSSLQSTILSPPGGFVLGQMVTNDAQQGVWVAPAGLGTVLSNVTQTERKFTPADLATLNQNNVNALRTRATGQVIIWGTRTMQTGYASLYVPVQRTLNYIEASLANLLEFVIFQPNDAILWNNIIATCTNFLDGMLVAGAFPTSQAATSFYVTCDTTNNTPQTVASGVVNATVGVALLFPAEFINLTIAQFQSTGVTTVTAAQ